MIITFDQFKKVLLRNPEYWNSKKDLKHLQSEVISATFSPTDFLRAFKVIITKIPIYIHISIDILFVRLLLGLGIKA